MDGYESESKAHDAWEEAALRSMRRNRRVFAGALIIVTVGLLALCVTRFTRNYRSALEGDADYYKVFASEDTSSGFVLAPGEREQIEARASWGQGVEGPLGRLPVTFPRDARVSIGHRGGSHVIEAYDGKATIEFWLGGKRLELDGYWLDPESVSSDFELIARMDRMGVTGIYPLARRLRAGVMLREALGMERERLLTYQVLKAESAPVWEEGVPSGPEYPVNIRGIRIGLCFAPGMGGAYATGGSESAGGENR